MLISGHNAGLVDQVRGDDTLVLMKPVHPDAMRAAAIAQWLCQVAGSSGEAAVKPRRNV